MVGGVIGGLVAFAVIAFILPVISIYFWIVVNSLRKKIIESRRNVMPFVAQPPPFGMAGKFSGINSTLAINRSMFKTDNFMVYFLQPRFRFSQTSYSIQQD